MFFANNKKINPIFQLLFLVLFGLFFFGGFVQPAQALTKQANSACEAFKKQFDTSHGNITEGLPIYCTASDILLKAFNIGMVAAGGIAVLFIMVGGYFYLTSAGNEEQAEKGRKILINSIIGLVVIIMAVVIVRIVAQTLQSNVGGRGNNPPGGQAGGGNNNPPFYAANNPDALRNAFSIAALSDKKNVRVIFSVSSKDSAEFAIYKQSIESLCSVPLRNAGISMSVDGQTVDSKILEIDSQNISQTLTNNPGVSGKVHIIAKLCDKPMKEGDVTLNQNSDSLPAGSADIQEAANRSSFSSILSSNNKTLTINLTASPQDMDIMCASIAKPRINLLLDGVQKDSQSTDVRQFTVQISGSATPFIGIQICHNDIVGAQPLPLIR